MTDPDPVESARLRALLDDAVADVQPGPALDRIRARTTVSPIRRNRSWLLMSAGAVAATAATITAVTLANGRAPQAGPDPDPAGASTTQGPLEPTTDAPSPSATEDPDSGTTAEPDPTPTENPSGSAAPGPGAGTVLLPVYFVGDTPAGPRLFRELQQETVAAGWSERLVLALNRAVRGEAVDDDYSSAWPQGSPEFVDADVDAASDRIVVALHEGAGLSQPPAGSTPDTARLAVQQLVHTAQAVVQQRAPVAFTDADGKPVQTLLGVDVSPEVTAAPAMEVQAPVWVTSPQDGAAVGSAFTVEGRGAFFEANVSWQLRREDGTVADEGFATAQECCTLSPYAFEVTAEPGTYVLRVYSADMSDGEGAGEPQDTKRITVR